MANLSDFIVIGDVYVITSDNIIDKKVDNKPLTPNVGDVTKRVTAFKDSLKSHVTETVRPGAIHRPSAGELMAKEEPEIKKAADNAVKETLDAVPELRAARDNLEKLKHDR